MSKFDKPIFIIGAGRSGTTILKKTLSHHPEFYATAFELNYLWRAGNAGLLHDQIDPDEHSGKISKSYIRFMLWQMLKRSGKKRLVEKTVANVMRVPYIYSVFPEARVIHIIRDGRDVAASAMKRWRAHSGGGYLFRKALTIPPFDLPRYGFRYLKNKVKRAVNKTGHDASWGPRWPDMDEEIKGLPLPAICARQWVKSIEAVEDAKWDFPDGQYTEIRYEDLLKNTGAVLDHLQTFLELGKPPAEMWNYAKNNIRDQGNGWEKNLSENDLALIMSEAGETLDKLGYLDENIEEQGVA